MLIASSLSCAGVLTNDGSIVPIFPISTAICVSVFPFILKIEFTFSSSILLPSLLTLCTFLVGLVPYACSIVSIFSAEPSCLIPTNENLVVLPASLNLSEYTIAIFLYPFPCTLSKDAIVSLSVTFCSVFISCFVEILSTCFLLKVFFSLSGFLSFSKFSFSLSSTVFSESISLIFFIFSTVIPNSFATCSNLSCSISFKSKIPCLSKLCKLSTKPSTSLYFSFGVIKLN